MKNIYYSFAVGRICNYYNQCNDKTKVLFSKKTKDWLRNKNINEIKENARNLFPSFCEITNLTKMFEFKNLEQMERLSHVLAGFYEGENDLYKDESKNKLFLLVQKSHHTPEEFNKVCNVISEYGIHRKYAPAKEAFLKEHGKLLVKTNALQVLETIG